MESDIMAENKILKEFTNMFEAEKYNKFQISEYNLTKFKKIETLMQEAIKENIVDDLRTLSEEALHENDFNFSALFVLGVLNYQADRIVDATKQFQKLINFFKKKNKLGILEYLSRKMLEFGDDIFALQNLIFALQANNAVSELIPFQERLVLLDSTNTTILLQLAAYKKKENDIKAALKYYLMALNNFIEKADKKQVDTIWRQIIDLVDDPLIVLLPLEKVLLANFEHEFVFSLLNILAENINKDKQVEDAINLYKKLLKFHPENKELRADLINLYSKKYVNHSHFEEYVLLSGLKQWWNEVFDSIDKFEKYIQFDVNRYVYHEGWGVGVITEIKNKEVKIDFEKERDHKMTFDMALSSLRVLPDEHIKVYKRYKKEELLEAVKKNPIRIIEIISQKIDKKIITVDMIKNETVDDLLSVKEWSRWWTKLKSLIKINPHFEFVDTKTLRYISTPIRYEEKLKQDFEEANSFDTKVTLAESLISHDKQGALELNLYQEIADYFQSLLSQADDKIFIRSYLLLLQMQKHKNELKLKIDKINFAKHLPQGEQLQSLFNEIKETENKRLFVKLIEQNIEDSCSYFEVLLFSHYSPVHNYLIDKVLESRGKKAIQEYFNKIIEEYKEYPDIFFWLAKSVITEAKEVSDYEIDKTTIYINLMFLYSFVGRKLRVIQGQEEEDYKKIQKNILSLFFGKKEPHLLTFVVDEKKKNNPKIETLISLVLDNKYLSDKYKKMLIDAVRNLENMIIT